MAEVEKCCKNCKHLRENSECVMCTSNFDKFEPKEKEIDEKKIRNKAIDEFQREIKDWQIDIQDNEHDADKFDFVFERIYEIAEELKGARE